MSANDGGGNGTPKTITVPTPRAGEVARQEFGASQVSQSGETAMTAMAAQAEALIKARCAMALARPRDLMAARARLLKDCARPAFADAAIYRKPVGDGIEGPSIRLAEAAARAMTNIEASVAAIYDDPKKRIVRVSATDLQSNLTYWKDVTVPKTMERSKLKSGQQPISHRFNSKGAPVFLVAAETDDDILNTENALSSKAMRVCLLRLVPGDLLDEAMREAYNTLEKNIKDDPDKAVKEMCDVFEMQLGIAPEQLADYLGHPVSQTTIPEIATMRKLFSALKDGETSWAEVLENRGSAPPSDPPKAGDAAAPVAARGKANVNDLAAQAKAKREATPAAATPPVGATAKGDPLARAEPAREPGADDEDEKNRRAAAPTDDELPGWAKR